MKDKERLSMYVDITRITITLCWIALIAFWCLKLFGGNWFEIMVQNENFIKFCKFAEKSWLKDLINLFTIIVTNYFLFGAISQKFYFPIKKTFIIIGLLVSMWAIRFLPNILGLHFWYGYLVIILYGIFVQKGYKKWFGVLGVLINFVFTTISIFVRNLPLELTTNFLIGNILLIDMYIMYVLYYLYFNLIRLEKENNMAYFIGYGWLSKESAQIKGYNSWRRFWHNFGYALSFKWAKKK